jgi:hypothetical protein
MFEELPPSNHPSLKVCSLNQCRVWSHATAAMHCHLRLKPQKSVTKNEVQLAACTPLHKLYGVTKRSSSTCC